MIKPLEINVGKLIRKAIDNASSDKDTDVIVAIVHCTNDILQDVINKQDEMIEEFNKRQQLLKVKG